MEDDMILLSVDTSSSRFSIALLNGGSLIDEHESLLVNRHSSELLPGIDRLLSRNSYGIEDIGAFCVGLGPGSFTGLRVGITTMRALAMALKRPIVGIPSIDGVAYNLFSYRRSGLPDRRDFPEEDKWGFLTPQSDAGQECPAYPSKGQICPLFQICVIVDARQNKVYARIYKAGKKNIRPKSRFLLITIRELLSKIKDLPTDRQAQTVFSGDGIGLYRDEIVKQKASSAEFAPESLWYPKAAIIGRLGLHKLKAGKKDNVFSLSPLYIYPKECQVRR